jgi:hypothetical protein
MVREGGCTVQGKEGDEFHPDLEVKESEAREIYMASSGQFTGMYTFDADGDGVSLQSELLSVLWYQLLLAGVLMVRRLKHDHRQPACRFVPPPPQPVASSPAWWRSWLPAAASACCCARSPPAAGCSLVAAAAATWKIACDMANSKAGTAPLTTHNAPPQAARRVAHHRTTTQAAAANKSLAAERAARGKAASKQQAECSTATVCAVVARSLPKRSEELEQ